MVGQNASERVGRSARWKWHDDSDWTRRIGLRHRGRHAGDEDTKRNCQKLHATSPIASAAPGVGRAPVGNSLDHLVCPGDECVRQRNSK